MPQNLVKTGLRFSDPRWRIRSAGVRNPQRVGGNINQCSGYAKDSRICGQAVEGNGRRGGTRTPDPRIRNPMLYPAELHALANPFYYKKIGANLGAVVHLGITETALQGFTCASWTGMSVTARIGDAWSAKKGDELRWGEGAQPQKKSLYWQRN